LPCPMSLDKKHIIDVLDKKSVESDKRMSGLYTRTLQYYKYT